MKTYYFYTLNKVEYPEYILNEYEQLSEYEEKAFGQRNVLVMAKISNIRKVRDDQAEKFRLDNGQDIRYFSRYGLKEITEEDYNIIKEDESKITASFSQKTINLLTKFNHRTDGWHFPIAVEASDRSHLKWKLKDMFPDYKEFIFKDFRAKE